MQPACEWRSGLGEVFLGFRGLRTPIPHSPTDAIVNVTVSIGAALYPHSLESHGMPLPTNDARTAANQDAVILDELVRTADSAVYQAKTEGRDGIAIIPKTLQDHHLPPAIELKS